MKRFVAVFLVAASVVFGTVGQANAHQGESKLVRLWGSDTFGRYAIYLTADQAKETYEWAHDQGGSALAGAAILGLWIPALSSFGGSIYLGGDAIKSCSDSGKHGVIIYGIRHKRPFSSEYMFLPTNCASQG